MLKNAQTLVKEHDMLPPGSTVLCAVSGGADSICLLHWLSRREDISLTAAHFNHQLRGEESDRDEAFVRDLCAQWNIPLTVGRGDVKAFSEREGLSLEEGGRILRYAFLEGAAQTEGCGRIATAHTADDNAETVLMHLLRGTGLQGLCGIPLRRGRLIRPLLTTSRAEIEAYLDHFQLPHVEDSSNQNDDFLRNKIRHQIVPLLEELAPGFVERMTLAVPRFGEDNSYLNAEAARLSAQAQTGPEGISISAALIAQAPQPIAVRVVRQLMAQVAGGCWDGTAAHLEAITALCRTEAPSVEVHLPHGLTARREYDRLVLSRQTEPLTFSPFTPQQGDNPVPGTDWTVALHTPPWPGLVIRPRQPGDELTLPSGHTRSLKKLFIDRKVPRPLRESFPVAADGDGVVFAAPFGPNLSHPYHKNIQIIETKEDIL